MCDQYNNRGCEVVDELHLEITNLEMTIADLKVDIMKDLNECRSDIYDTNNSIIDKKIKKWEAK